MDACCESTIAESEDDEDEDEDDSLIPNSILDFGSSYRTCTCGSTWKRVRGGSWTFYQQERKCIVCGHWSCPCCGDYCDSTVDGEDGEIEMCSCDGQCTYTESPLDTMKTSDGTIN